MDKCRSALRTPLGARARRAFARLALLSLAAVGTAAAQGAGYRDEVFAGSDPEEYLRTLQVVGRAPLYPWAVRGFSPAEVGRLLPADDAHPWAARFAPGDTTTEPGFRLLAPRLQQIYNSGFAYGYNDGPLWAGRGMTVAVQAGAAARYGPVSLVLAPIFFRAENREFELKEGLKKGMFDEWIDPIYPLYIDLPQRFGPDPYARFDLGESTLRVDAGPVAAGVSTASGFWGPASEMPLILGNNAGGFPHLFVGTTGPKNVYVGKVHGRILWGRLDQSAYSPMPDSTGLRFATGVVGVFTPRGLPGLEIGASRFFHNIWPEDGLTFANFAQPFQEFLKSSLPVQAGQDTLSNDDLRKWSPDNQLASVFVRWVFPRTGFELYAEYGREDSNYDKRDVVLELTHNSGYLVGMRKAWAPSPSDLFALRAEVLNTRPGITTYAHDIPQYPFYLHGAATQGHTQRGQILASPAGYGGAGEMVAFDHFHRRGQWTVQWNRVELGERDRNWTDPEETGVGVLDVMHSLGVSGVLFTSRVDVQAGVTAAYEFNRDFSEDDAFNLNATLGIRAPL